MSTKKSQTLLNLMNIVFELFKPSQMLYNDFTRKICYYLKGTI